NKVADPTNERLRIGHVDGRNQVSSNYAGELACTHVDSSTPHDEADMTFDHNQVQVVSRSRKIEARPKHGHGARVATDGERRNGIMRHREIAAARERNLSHRTVL